MRRVTLCVLSFCILASIAIFSGPAKAGDDYAYRSQRSARVWYTSSCCYRQIVRDVAVVRYVPIRRDYYWPRTSYYRHYRPRRYYVVRYRARYDGRRAVSYRFANFVSPSDCRLVRVANIDGTWAWARRAGCL
jgi:hypothetical protein